MNQLPTAGTSRLPLTGKIQVVQTFMDIAQRTGGEYCLLRKDRDCFYKMVNYASQYYLLTYYTNSSKSRRWHEIAVKAHQSGLEVRARRGYFSAEKVSATDNRRKQDIARALAAPVEYRGLLLSARWGSSDSADVTMRSTNNIHPKAIQPKRKFELGIAPGALTVDTADKNHMQLDVVACVLGRDGKMESNISQDINMHPSTEELTRMHSEGIVYSNAVKLTPESLKVRFVVRDALSGDLGTLSIPVVSPAQP
jgi:hypothetical protein